MELLDVVDENNQLTGRTEDKEIIHAKGLWHREIAVWIMNEKREILIQKRAATKKQGPNKWGLTAGHIDASEEPIHAAIRETFEEVGLEVEAEELQPLLVEKISEDFPNVNQTNSCFEYWYLLRTNKKIEEYVIEEKELSEVKYISLEELERIIQTQDDNYTFSDCASMTELFEILKKQK